MWYIKRFIYLRVYIWRTESCYAFFLRWIICVPPPSQTISQNTMCKSLKGYGKLYLNHHIRNCYQQYFDQLWINKWFHERQYQYSPPMECYLETTVKYAQLCVRRQMKYPPRHVPSRTTIINHVPSEGAAVGICATQTSLLDKPCRLRLVVVCIVNKVG